MARRSALPELAVRVSFEAARVAPQCLAETYERLVPIPRRPARRTERRDAPFGPMAAADQAPMQRADHG